ncbi:hypothetical protein D3C83_216140 [compost metagenome]
MLTLPDSRNTTNELQRSGQRLMSNVVDRDLQRWQVKSFAEDSYGGDAKDLTCRKRGEGLLGRP